MNATAARRGWVHHVAVLSSHRYSTALLAAIAFADSSFLPVPPDLLLVPMSLLRPERTRSFMVICILASSLGAVLGYAIGYELWNVVGAPLIEFYGYGERFAAYRQMVDQWGMTIIIAKAFTPIPFKIAAIAAGVGEMNFAAFITAAVFGRALHFAMVAGLIALFGARVTTFLMRYERPVAVISVVALIGVALGWYLR
jgi:membrane protein YqaA with SNARE-associated domain